MTKTALVSGAGKGIGRAIALRLAATGYDVFLLGRDGVALSAVATACAAQSVQADFMAGDLCEAGAIAAALEAANRRFGVIDVLVNNAGTAARGAVQGADLEAWRKVLDLNLWAAITLTRGVLPAMIARRQGAVINISSISGRHSAGGDAIYAASKHALNGLTASLFEDVREFGIKVSCIMPGFVETELTASLRKRNERMIGPDDVAACVDFVLASSARCCPTEVVLRPQLPP